jgi:hypothetical protein
MPELLRAALYVPRGLELHRWSAALTAVADAEGWPVASLVRRWEDMTDLMCDRLVDVAIVPSWDHLPPDRIPRVVAADRYSSPRLMPGQRRPEIRWHPSRGAQPPRPPSTRA